MLPGVRLENQRLLVGDTITAISDNPHAMRLRYSRRYPIGAGRFARQGQVSENARLVYSSCRCGSCGRPWRLIRRQAAICARDFTVEEGLPDNEVNAITQTRNGFLWVGTDGGLARFDGEHFTQIRLRAGISKEIPVSFLVDGGRTARFGLAPIPGLPTYRAQPWTTSIARW